MSKKNKDIVNTNKITINLSDVTKEKKEKKRRKKLRRRLLKKQEKELKQAKPAFSNFQYPQPIVVNAINPEKQKQLNLDYDKKLAQVLQTKFDEEFTKRENEKATKRNSSSEPTQENVGAFNAVDDGRGFSQTTDLLSKANNNYRTAQLNTETDNLYNKPFLSAFPVSQTNNISEAISVKAQKEVDHFCPICGKGYRLEGALKKHIIKEHPNETPATPPSVGLQPKVKPTASNNADNQDKNKFVIDFSDDPVANPTTTKKPKPPRPDFTDVISPTTPVITRKIEPVTRPKFDSALFQSPKLIPETNAPSQIDEALSNMNDEQQVIVEADDIVDDNILSQTVSKSKRGRPKGSKNKSSNINDI